MEPFKLTVVDLVFNSTSAEVYPGKQMILPNIDSPSLSE